MAAAAIPTGPVKTAMTPAAPVANAPPTRPAASAAPIWLNRPIVALALVSVCWSALLEALAAFSLSLAAFSSAALWRSAALGGSFNGAGGGFGAAGGLGAACGLGSALGHGGRWPACAPAWALGRAPS